MNAHAERFVLTIKSECLDHFIVFGEAHLRYLISQYMAYYLQERPHQGVGNRPLTAEPPPPHAPVAAARTVVCDERLGGLLKSYRVAA